MRHTAATKMAEAGIPESTMLALMGHMSRAMLERYSHIRMTAKREAVKVRRIREEETPRKLTAWAPIPFRAWFKVIRWRLNVTPTNI